MITIHIIHTCWRLNHLKRTCCKTKIQLRTCCKSKTTIYSFSLGMITIHIIHTEIELDMNALIIVIKELDRTLNHLKRGKQRTPDAA